MRSGWRRPERTARTWRAVVALLAVSSCLAGKGPDPMKEADRLIADLGRISDEAYLAMDPNAAGPLPLAAMDSGFDGIALGAPHAVPAGAAGIPALLVSSESPRRSAETPLHENAIAVAVDLESGTVFVGEAFPPDPSKSPEDPPAARPAPASEEPAPDPETAKALEELGDGRSAGTAWLEFEKLLEIPRRASRLALRVVVFDRITNAALAKIEGPEAEIIPPPRSWAAGLAPESGTAGEPPSRKFGRTSDTPALSSEGAALSLSGGEEGGAPRTAHGSLKMSVPRGALVPEEFGTTGPGSGRPPSVVLAAVLLIARQGSNHPTEIRIGVPVWSAGAKAGDVVEADFSLDLTKEIRPPLRGGSYCAWLLAGPHASAPQRFDVSPGH